MAGLSDALLDAVPIQRLGERDRGSLQHFRRGTALDGPQCACYGVLCACFSCFFFASFSFLLSFCFWAFPLSFLPPLSPIAYLLLRVLLSWP